MAKAMLMDTNLCLDCNACTVECKRNNDVPSGQEIFWTQMEEYEIGVYPDVKTCFIKHACNHCTDAACEKACPVGAISKPDGTHVVVDKGKCIQCGYCRMACPFNVPHYGDPSGPSQKCSFCYDRRDEDEPTACAAACPFGAITFGERDELIAEGNHRVSQLKAKGFDNAYLYGVNEMGGTNVLYVLTESPDKYELPVDAQVPATVSAWKNVIQPIGWIAGGITLVGLGVNYIVARANMKKEAK